MEPLSILILNLNGWDGKAIWFEIIITENVEILTYLYLAWIYIESMFFWEYIAVCVPNFILLNRFQIIFSFFLGQWTLMHMKMLFHTFELHHWIFSMFFFFLNDRIQQCCICFVYNDSKLIYLSGSFHHTIKTINL